ncbi:hypothetical protein EGW08_015605 [Elysia chlorotica]|uniref:Zinc transporter ZIP1 n=1 Tax=Elysia chlorotica TaxID=188477 RepID=A0A3S1B757_ELYCH|nr:hypothetical protein EGW08_015605 [Elysia chlorotica]
MDTDMVKIICMVVLFLDTLLFGWPPYFLVRSEGRSDKFNRIRKTVLSYLTCFSGGVFLGACLLHLLPEGLENVQRYLEQVRYTIDYPIFEAMIGAGFFLIALIEQLAHKLIHSSGHAHSHKPEGSPTLVVSEGNPFRALLLLIALSFHTIFDGLAVGLTSGTSSVWQMFGAICIHKSLVALCLGTELFLLYVKKPLRAFLIVFFFAIIAPLGVGLGMILTSSNVDDGARTLTDGLLQGVATGTFLYVTFFEILREELIDKGGLLRLLLVAIGFGGMAAAKVVDAE